MKYTILFILLSLALTLSALTAPPSSLLTQDRAEAFINTLIYDRPSLEKFVDPADLKTSNRLRIQYEGVDWKILIGHDIDVNIREKIMAKEIGYNVTIKPLTVPFTKLLFETSDSTFKQVFFFKNDMMISPLTYFTRNMYKFSRGYVTFYTTDPSLLNNYSMSHVNSFIKKQSLEIASFFDLKNESEWLSFNDASWRHYYGIRYNPLIYIVCKDARQIEQITGFNTLGLSDLSMDAVISTSNSHYHELVHLLMNFNLNPMHLYTHPLLQEGIATYLGGRGGKSADVMFQTGEWLQDMNLIPLDTLLSNKTFQQQDASISYPLSALICSKFIDQYGMKEFTRLYKKYSVRETAIHNLRISQVDLNLTDLFHHNKIRKPLISCSDLSNGLFDLKFNKHPKFQNSNLTIWNAVSLKNHKFFWKFEGIGTYLSIPGNRDAYQTGSYKGYKSRLFAEMFPGRKYNSEHYLLIMKEDEISLYDLYLDQLIAFYSNEFVPESRKMVFKNGKVTFYLDMDDARFSFEPQVK
jgi:hypothetical protein